MSEPSDTGTGTGTEDERRWRLLADAVVTMAADLELDALLGRIVAIAADLAGARFAALGVLDQDSRRRLSTFITHGLDGAHHRAIGALPTGHGILGLIIDRPEPLRLRDISAHAESYGFPAHHPAMTSFLGVPIDVRAKVFGNLYLTEKIDGEEFTELDEEIVVALAAAAGVAILNAQLHDEARRRQGWLTATAQIASTLVGSDPRDALQIVADRARELAAADVAWVVAAEGRRLTLAAVSGAESDQGAFEQLDLEHSLARMVTESHTPITVDDMASDPRATNVAASLGWPAVGPAILVPFRDHSGPGGVLALGWVSENREAFRRLDPSLPTRFAEHAALAVQVARSRDDERRLALLEDRDRIARDLHDLVIQRLFAAGLSLEAGIRPVVPSEAIDRLDDVVEELDGTIKDIRRTIFALGSGPEATGDLDAELVRLVDRITATLKFRPALDVSGPLRTTVTDHVAEQLLAVLGEALSNAARHAHASSINVRVAVGDHLTLTVTDDGVGIADDITESGLRNVRERAAQLAGSCEISSSSEHGTTLTWTVPLRPDASDGPDVRP